PREVKRGGRREPQDGGVIHRPEATALIVGVGGIGGEAARLAAAFGMHVMGIDARRREAPPGVLKLDGPDALDSLLPLADFVILTVPHTPATEGFMHRARFQRMKRTAFSPASRSATSWTRPTGSERRRRSRRGYRQGDVMRRLTWCSLALVFSLAALAFAPAPTAPQTKKLVYWTHWEQNPEFNKFY